MKYFNPGKYTEKQIDKEYRRLSLIHHPDRPTGSNESFQQLSDEYRKIKQQFADKAKKRGDQVNYKRIIKDIKTLDDIFDRFNVPQELRPIAKAIAERFGEQFTNQIKIFINNK